MNLRILKKLSKRAAPYLPLIKDTRMVFKAEKEDNYTGLLIRDKTCWERSTSAHGDKLWPPEIIWKPRNPEGRQHPFCRMHPPCHPLKGTVMVGATEGYEEPEWEEETAWEALCKWVCNQHWHYDPKADRVSFHYIPRTVSEVFEEADRLLGRAAA